MSRNGSKFTLRSAKGAIYQQAGLRWLSLSPERYAMALRMADRVGESITSSARQIPRARDLR